MRRRCLDPKNDAYEYYGARGIRVSAEWATFLPFLDWALTSGYAAGLQLDRIDADGPYAPSNCRWVSQQINVTRRELDRAGDYLKKLAGRLTDEQIGAATARGRAFKLADGGGLFLWISTTGAKSWRYAYRVGGQEKLLVLGKHPRITLWEARELHAIAKAQLQRGSDPAVLKQARKRRRLTS